MTCADDGESTKLGNITRVGYGDVFEDGSAGILRGEIMKVEVCKKSDWKVTKTWRIQKWREKVAASYYVCRWVRDSQKCLETADGKIALHPQDILMEVEKKGIAQFTKGNDEDKRKEFMS